MLTKKVAAVAARGLSLSGANESVETIVAAAKKQRPVSILEDEGLRSRVADSAEIISRAVANCENIYGVTTGFGGMADQEISGEHSAASQNNLLSFLSTGAGPAIDRRHVRAAMILRANVLLQGCSGVRMELIQRLVRFIEADAIPIVRELGSIGASGDLVPLSTIARAITGTKKALR